MNWFVGIVLTICVCCFAFSAFYLARKEKEEQKEDEE